MTTPTIGADCHVVLSHPSIDAGARYGLICPLDDSIREAGVQVNRQVISESTTVTDPHWHTVLWIRFDIICGDALRAPNGVKHPKTRAQDYAKLMEFLLETDGITLETPIGAFTNLGALGFSADERHTPEHSIIKCELNNAGYYFPPVDPNLLLASVWDGGLTWDTSYWR